MTIYSKIGDAFGEYVRAARAVRRDFLSVAQFLRTELIRLGQIPKELLAFHNPNDTSADLDLRLGADDAIKYNDAAESALIGFILEVKQGNDLWPIELLRFDVMIAVKGDHITIRLRDDQATVTFERKDTVETRAAMTAFASHVLKSIEDYYLKLSRGDAAKNITGFAQIRPDAALEPKAP